MAYPSRFSLTAQTFQDTVGRVENPSHTNILSSVISPTSTVNFYPTTPLVMLADGTIDRATATTDKIIGFKTKNPIKDVCVAGELIDYATNDAIFKMKAAANIDAGVDLEIVLTVANDDLDQVTTATTGTVIGTAQNKALAGEIVKVLLKI